MTVDAEPRSRPWRVALVRDDDAGREAASAMDERRAGIAQAIEAAGHQLTIVAPGPPTTRGAAAPSRHDRRRDRALVESLRRLRPDVVVATMNWPALPLLLGRDVPVVLVAEDVPDTSPPGSGSPQRPWPTRLRPPRVVVTAAEADRRWATRRWPRSAVLTVPHGIDVEHWAEEVEPEPRWTAPVFTVGDYRDRANLERLLAVTDEIERRGLGRTVAIGVASAAPLITPAVPALHPLGTIADPRRGYAGAHLALVPLVEGPAARTQILRAWASGCPVVTTTSAARVVQGRDGRDLAAAPDAAGIVDRIVRLMADPAQAQRVAERARRAVAARHSLDALAAGVDAALWAATRRRATTTHGKRARR